MGQLYDQKIQCEKTIDDILPEIKKYEKIVRKMEANAQYGSEYDLACQQLTLWRDMYYSTKYSLDAIELGHYPDDRQGIYSLRVGENDFADRYCKEDRRVSKRRANLQTNW